MLPQEIERKFLVSVPPADLTRYPAEPIAQGYLAQDADGTVVRLRRKGDAHFLTVKGPGDVARMELEVALTPAQFEVLWPATAGRRLEKTRYLLPLGPYRVEYDVYRGPLSGLATVEVEFPSVQAATDFTPPDWFGQEVTRDRRYRNAQMALHGLPST